MVAIEAGQTNSAVDGAMPDRATLLAMYQTMVNIRAFETRLVELFNAGKLGGVLHVYLGEEACAAGTCIHLKPSDYLLTSHRGHGHVLAKGADMDRMMAELFARETGLCRARGGSMHIIDRSVGILGANAIVAANVPIATGAGLAAKWRDEGQVVICFFGDGATNHGAFHEGVNLAAVWDLPVVFVCENNLYAQFTSQRIHTKITDLAIRAEGYGIPGVQADGQDVLAVYGVAQAAVERARNGGGPTLIELKTYRYTGHAISNPLSAIGRPEEEIDSWKARDPIALFERRLIDQGIYVQSDLTALCEAATARVDAAVAFAEASPHPRPETALEHVYTEYPVGVPL
ncbi:MAG: Pyruvate dehydrogenase (Acetyl-transferring) component subunit alpha [Chloroflexi bacterium]|nr:Pyruvate dehydrogenase (Acetyl-transferring) component subunit alpha [Chloroflexota bacterium]